MPSLEDRPEEYREEYQGQYDDFTTAEMGAQKGTSERSSPIPIPERPERKLSRKLSEESIRTDLCDGPVPESPQPRTPDKEMANTVTDRAELIERLKRGESPTWIPNRHLESLLQQNGPRSPTRSPRPLPTSPASQTLLPAANITPERINGDQEDRLAEERMQVGLNIERPRSALHSGNFTPDDQSPDVDAQAAQEATGLQEDGHSLRSSNNLWISTSPPRDFQPFPFERGVPSYRKGAFVSVPSSLSSSLSSSFAYKAPTSPLVQAETHDDMDLSLPMDNIDITPGSPRSIRRHTLNLSQSSPFASSLLQRQGSGLRRDGSFHFQAHQPRRSLTSTPSLPMIGTSPSTPAYIRSRRPSVGSEASPIQHASMVGSYEESILRGRMSTTPSKPLDFMAQIGVLGLGKCKASLRCPAHVTLPFSAVFYSYASTSHGRSKAEDGPSPYVGQIDLENGLSSPEEDQRAKRKIQSRYPERKAPDEEMSMEDGVLDASDADSRSRTATAAAKAKRRSKSPKAPPGGRYRIPEKGQLQIIIKNQNKTAVKLFLVPYDLAGMEPGTKTFIRQRSYSAGPIIDNVPDAKDAGPSGDRPILRYLIHLHICCPSKGRFYLYKSIRVVFANRVPDGKEKLRNEITHPEPRFSPYKPVRVMHPPSTTPSSAGAMRTAAEQAALRRRSAGFSFAQYPSLMDSLRGIPSPPPFKPASLYNSPAFSAPGGVGGSVPVAPIPFRLPQKNLVGNLNDGGEAALGALTSTTSAVTTVAPAQSLDSSLQTSRSTTQDSMTGMVWTGPGESVTFGTLSKGDVGLGGFASTRPPGSPGTAEGLLSKRLRSLGVQSQAEMANNGGVDGGGDGSGL